MMIEELREAFERAAQQSIQEQAVIAASVNEMLDADTRWDELLSDPRGLSVLEQMAEEAHQEYLRGETQDLDDLLAEDDDVKADAE